MKALKSKITKKVKKIFMDGDSKVTGDTGNIDPPSRPQSALSIRPSESTPATLERRKSDGKQTGLLVRFCWFLDVRFVCTVGPARPSDVLPVSAHHLSASNVNKNEPADVPSPVVDPTATLPATAATTSEIPSVPGPRISVHDVDENDPPRLSSYGVNPTAAYENKSNWKSTLYAGTKVAVDLVKESSDVFAPLKSVAGGLSAVLKYYDVRHFFFSQSAYERSLPNQQTMANRKTIESLVPRIEGLAESLKEPAPEGEVEEIERREKLVW